MVIKEDVCTDWQLCCDVCITNVTRNLKSFSRLTVPAFLHQNQHFILLLDRCGTQTQSKLTIPKTRKLTVCLCFTLARHCQHPKQCTHYKCSLCTYVYTCLCSFMCLTHRVHSICGGESPLLPCPPGRREVCSPPEQTSQPWMFVDSSHLYT